MTTSKYRVVLYDDLMAAGLTPERLARTGVA